VNRCPDSRPNPDIDALKDSANKDWHQENFSYGCQKVNRAAKIRQPGLYALLPGNPAASGEIRGFPSSDFSEFGFFWENLL
jgi:hypothetical protein